MLFLIHVVVGGARRRGFCMIGAVVKTEESAEYGEPANLGPRIRIEYGFRS
jgi:hypothetical protein